VLTLVKGQRRRRQWIASGGEVVSGFQNLCSRPAAFRRRSKKGAKSKNCLGRCRL